MTTFEGAVDRLVRNYLGLAESIWALKYVSSRKRDHSEDLGDVKASLLEMLDTVEEMRQAYR